MRRRGASVSRLLSCAPFLEFPASLFWGSARNFELLRACLGRALASPQDFEHLTTLLRINPKPTFSRAAESDPLMNWGNKNKYPGIKLLLGDLVSRLLASAETQDA